MCELVEDKESKVGKEWSRCEGPPESACGPTGGCPKCLANGVEGGGCLVYGFESKRYVCIVCWSVFKEVGVMATNCEEFCEVCRHGVYSLEKHLQTEDHRRNVRRCELERLR